MEYILQATPYYAKKGRPRQGQNADGWVYQVVITGIPTDWLAIQQHITTLGRFILATNVLDTASLSDEAMLLEYKEQSEIERGFRFIQNDTFGLDNLFLKNPGRIGALMAVMTLCLWLSPISLTKCVAHPSRSPT